MEAPKVSTARRGTTMRDIALWTHRYVGLVIATFLLLSGITGSIIAFYAEIDAALHPKLFRVAPPSVGAATLDPFEIQETLNAKLPEEKRVRGVILRVSPDASLNYWVDGREMFVDPYTGKVLGARTWGDLSEGLINLMPFIYRLHFSLALEEVGTVIFGCVALLWTLDCFVGAYLTLPRPTRRNGERGSRKSWLVRWAPAWLIKANKLFSLVFTWHRASGLWIWGMLLVFAWSAVALNLGEQVYQPVMSTFFGKEDDAYGQLPAHVPARDRPRIAGREAREIGRRHMASKAAANGFRVLVENGLDYDPEHGAYSYTVESSLDPAERFPETTVYFDGNDGKLLGFSALTGQHTGRTITTWLIALHFGAIRAGGLAYRIFVSVLGVGTALLSISGVWIWWKRRKGRGAET